MTSPQTTDSNPRCPNFGSHYENAADRICPDWRRVQPVWDTRNDIDAEAEREYLGCDGH